MSFLTVSTALLSRSLYATQDSRTMLVVKRISRRRDVGVLAVLFGTLIVTYTLLLGVAFLVAMLLSSRYIFVVTTTVLSVAGGA